MLIGYTIVTPALKQAIVTVVTKMGVDGYSLDKNKKFTEKVPN